MPSRDDALKIEKVGKALPKAQKIIIIGALVAAILVFLYSFIFMTPFADLYQIDGSFLYQKIAKFSDITPDIIASFPNEAYYKSPFFEGDPIGLNLAYFTSFTRNEFQVINHWLFVFGFFGLLASLVPLVYFSQKRKIYYKTNIIVIPLVAAFNLYIGIHMMIQLVSSHILVLSKATDYMIINAYETYLNDVNATKIIDYFHITDANPTFIIGYVIASAVIVFAISSCILVIVKSHYQKSQKQIDLSKVVINE